jgi:glutathione S-transferase
MGIDFYTHPASGPARMCLLLAKHLDVDLNVKFLDLFQGEQMKPEFLALNPTHTVPTLVENGFVIYESRAILAYLQNKFGKDDSLYPKDPQKRALVDMKLYLDATVLYPRFGETVYPVLLAGQRVDPSRMDKLNETLGFVEEFLKDGGYIVGKQLTIADFSLAASLSTIEACHGLAKFPKIVAYLEKCKAVMKGYDELNQQGAEEFSKYYKGALAKLNA